MLGHWILLALAVLIVHILGVEDGLRLHDQINNNDNYLFQEVIKKHYHRNLGSVIHIPALDYAKYSDTTRKHYGDDGCGVGPVDGKYISDNICNSRGAECTVGWTTPGEWLNYNFHLQADSDVDITIRISSASASREIVIDTDDGTDNDNVSELVRFNGPGKDWNTFEDRTISGVPFLAGSHSIYIRFPSGQMNLCSISILTASGHETTVPPITSTPQVTDPPEPNPSTKFIPTPTIINPLAPTTIVPITVPPNMIDITTTIPFIPSSSTILPPVTTFPVTISPITMPPNTASPIAGRGVSNNRFVVPVTFSALESYSDFDDTSDEHYGDTHCTSGAVDGKKTDDKTCNNNGADCYVGWIREGEWLRYDFSMKKKGDVDITLALASRYNGKVVDLEIDALGIVGSVHAPGNGWNIFSERSIYGVELSKGKHQLFLRFKTGHLNVCSISIVESTGLSIPANASIPLIDSPTPQPNPPARIVYFPQNPEPRNPPSTYFNYDPDSKYGPHRWNEVNTRNHWLKEFGPSGSGPWKGHYSKDITRNQCGGNERRQSPKNLSKTPSTECTSTHEIRTKCATHALIDNDAFEKQILPHKLSIKTRRRPCLDVQENGIGKGKCVGHRPPMVDYPKYSSAISDYADLHHMDFKIPGEHTLEGVAFDAEIQLLHTHLGDERMAAIGIPIRAKAGKFNQEFQWILDAFQKVFDEHKRNCDDLGRSLRQNNLETTSSKRKDVNSNTTISRDLKAIHRRKFNPYSDSLMPGMFFYRYDGSITEPPCKDITWWVMDKPCLIDLGQLNQLKTLLFGHIDSKCKKTSVHNKDQSVVRPIQPLGENREIQHCLNGSFRSDIAKGRPPAKECRR